MIPVSLLRVGLLSISILCGQVPTLSASPKNPAEAEQLRLIQSMAEAMRSKMDQLPRALEKTSQVDSAFDFAPVLNQAPVVVEGRRFDGFVISTPESKVSFAWSFITPPNVSRWYIFRENGEMNGFGDFLQRPASVLKSIPSWIPSDAKKVTFQKLNASALSPAERYVIWFEFKDSQPTQVFFRAGYFLKPSLNNSQLPALLFPATAPRVPTKS